jgi:hypothetical protein
LFVVMNYVVVTRIDREDPPRVIMSHN